MMNIAVIGNTGWQNKRKVKDVIFQLKHKYSDCTLLGAGGKEGAGLTVRKFALEMGLDYKEYNPSFSGYNLYSAMPESYYGKKYHFSQLHHRITLLVKNSQYIIILANGELDIVMQTAYKYAKKLNIPVVILN